MIDKILNLIKRVLYSAGLAALGLGLTTPTLSLAEDDGDDDLFGDPDHRVVYQLNKAAPDYLEQVLFSVGAMLRKHGDKIHFVVAGFVPGIHSLAKVPGRPVPGLVQQRVASLSLYGVEFHACGNTMKALGWTEKDLVDFATVVEVGIDDIVNLQEQGYSYISW